jgi:dephospho-CoA kinase
MQPGQAVYAAIVERFGPAVVTANGSLDRAALAQMAFADGRIEELNAIVHPAAIEGQAVLVQEIAERQPDAVVIVESALIFETKYGGEQGWDRRFDKLILVRAAQDAKIARFVERASSGRTLNGEAKRLLELEARRRLAQQMGDDAKALRCDYVLTNDGTVEQLHAQIDVLWPVLRDAAKN